MATAIGVGRSNRRQAMAALDGAANLQQQRERTGHALDQAEAAQDQATYGTALGVVAPKAIAAGSAAAKAAGAGAAVSGAGTAGSLGAAAQAAAMAAAPWALLGLGGAFLVSELFD